MIGLLLAAALSATTAPADLGIATQWTAPDGRTVSQLIAAHVLPDPAVTPGVLNPAVTQATIRVTVCKSGWTKTVRPPVSYTDPLKIADTPPGLNPKDGELDHFVSIEDGGAPADPHNLWWQAYGDRYGARVKDVLETKLKRLVCKGTVPLATAQGLLLNNWLIAYQTYVGPLP